MKHIYIGGDSFCYYRQANDWPGVLADKLNLQLTGRGFPGDSWWHTRQNLLQYLSTVESNSTELFVFCHTDPFRILTSQVLFKNLEADNIKKNYFKYFVDYEISLWTVKHWYLELNQLLKNQKVIHFQCFSSSSEPFQLLSGIRVITPLVELSMNNSTENFMQDTRRNHFDPLQNQLFAQKIIECLNSDANNLEISF
jgi:hypothetical protein